MHNVYLYDTLFAIFYLTVKRVSIAFFEVNPVSFDKYRRWYYYLEFSIVMFGVIYMPQHTKSEAFVGFMFSIVIKFCFNYFTIIPRTIKKIVETLAHD